MSEFEDNLWREVQRTYGAELSDAPDPLQRRSRLRVPVLAGTSLGVVGGSVAVVIVLTAASSPPAFAVTRHADGTVSVMIRRIDGIAGANRRLALLGIRARAVRVSGFCSAAPPPALAQVTVATVRGRSVNWVGVAPGRIAERIHPAQIPAGRTLVIPAVPGGSVVRLVHGRVVDGRVPACLPPVVFVRAGSGPAGGRIVICRAGIAPYPGAVVTAAPTNTNGAGTTGTGTTGTGTTGTGTTGTGTTVVSPAPPPPAAVTGTDTNATSTNAGTGTGTADQGTVTNGATTTNDAAIPGPPPPGSKSIQLPLLRHCQVAIQRAVP